MQKRSCGACSECCKTHRVVELKKRPGKWCRFRVKGCGCSIYEERPKGCVDFECQWLMGYGAELERPDRTGIVIDFLVLELVGRTMVLWEAMYGAFGSEYGKTLTSHCIDLGYAVLQRNLSGKELLLVPASLQIPVHELETLADDKRKVFVVETRP